MLTLSDLNKAAQAKKALNATKETVVTTASKVMNAVAGVMPVTKNALDVRTEQLLVLHAGLEQRVDGLEEAVGVQVTVDVPVAKKRAYGLLEEMKLMKEEEAAKAEAAPNAVAQAVATLPAATSRREQAKAERAAKAAEQAAASVTPAPKQKTRIRFNEVPRVDIPVKN